MSVSISGTKTCSNTVSPTLTATVLTTLLAIAVENLTIAQLRQIEQAVERVSGGHAETATIGSILV
jgi:hypothetical protein